MAISLHKTIKHDCLTNNRQCHSTASLRKDIQKYRLLIGVVVSLFLCHSVFIELIPEDLAEEYEIESEYITRYNQQESIKLQFVEEHKKPFKTSQHRYFLTVNRALVFPLTKKLYILYSRLQVGEFLQTAPVFNAL